MALDNIGGLLEKRRSALMDYCIGQVGRQEGKFAFLRTPADLFELLRMDPLDNYAVPNSWVAEATSCAQQFIHAAYRKLEPGYDTIDFIAQDLKLWELYNNYPDWAAVQRIAFEPENYINPFVRLRKTEMFKTLENNLNQQRLNSDSVQTAMQDYLQTFEQICNLDVVSAFADFRARANQPVTPVVADYYIIARQRTTPFQCYWRKAEIELTASCKAVNPAAWSEWLPVDISPATKLLDVRPVLWNGRSCVVWADWHDMKDALDEQITVDPYRLEINLAFKLQNGQWSPPLNLHTSSHETDRSAGTRLIATVRIDDDHPKGKLGVLLINRRPGVSTPLDRYVVRDVLLRPVPEDDGTWLGFLADERFTDRLTVQHPYVPQLQPKVGAATEIEGKLGPYLTLQTLFLQVGDNDVWRVRGLCKPNGLMPVEDAIFKLTMKSEAGGDPDPVEVTMPSSGGWATPWMEIIRKKGGFTGTTVFTFGKTGSTLPQGSMKFSLTVDHLSRFDPPALEKNTLDAAQFLAFRKDQWLERTRLNSLFGPELVQRANVSIDAVYDWQTQFLAEPPSEAGPIDEPNGFFNGANGLYFWELYFHLPHLVYARLRTEDRYPEAQNWLHYLFDPQAPADATPPARPLYWRCRPLVGPGNLGCETDDPTDPDAIGYSAPERFRKLVFMEYVGNLIAWGDWYYRQLTRDSLVAAKLCYVQAEFLMGKPPLTRTVTRWKAQTVEELLQRSRSRPALEAFEQALDFPLSDVPSAAENAPLMGLLANEPFKLPINQVLLDLFELPGRRLSNLRNNLTLDGQPLDIPLFNPPTDPNQLLRELASGGAGGPRPMGGRLVVGAFHWRVSYELALRAVQALQDLGNQVLRLLEQRDRAELEEVQQQQLVELGSYAETVQKQTIKQLEANIEALKCSKGMAQQRADRYSQWCQENVSAVEYEVMDNLQLAKALAISSAGVRSGAAALAILPNIFGMAAGGSRLDAPLNAIAFGLEAGSLGWQMEAEKQATTEGYRLRLREWELQRDQALVEVKAINQQIDAQTLAKEAAVASQEQTLRSNSQALTVYNYLKKRATNAELFGWLLGQLKALHYQAYDAVVSLCLSAQASLSAETGDYDVQVNLPQVWLDNRHGLTAGEHLRQYMLRVEREFLQSYERRLERVKTVSLRRLFDDAHGQQPGFINWNDALSDLLKNGHLEFRLTQLLFDRDHPGEYCRLIKSLEVDLPVLTGPYEDVHATLLQIGSMTATRPTAQSVEYLHQPETGVGPADVLINLRSGQQIGLSQGIADAGIVTMKAEEGLLNPFENTGAVSRYQITFPWPDKEPQLSMLRSLTDIIVRIRYTAKAGEPPFTFAVKDLVTRALNGQQRRNKGAANHE